MSGCRRSLTAAAARAVRASSAARAKPRPGGSMLRDMRGIGAADTVADFVRANVAPGDVVTDFSKRRRVRVPKKISPR